MRIYVCDPTGRQVAAGAAFAEEGSVPVGEASSEQAGPARRAYACGSISAGAPLEPRRPVSLRHHRALRHRVVRSYTAFRTVKVAPDGAGRFRFFLNGEPLLLRGCSTRATGPTAL